MKKMHSFPFQYLFGFYIFIMQLSHTVTLSYCLLLFAQGSGARVFATARA